jgi:outer membrane protein insertion porin family
MRREPGRLVVWRFGGVVMKRCVGRPTRGHRVARPARPRHRHTKRPDTSPVVLLAGTDPAILRSTMCAAVPALFRRLALLMLLLAAGAAQAQDDAVTDDWTDLSDRPISEVQIVGITGDDIRLVRNNLRAAAGDPFDAQTVRDDVRRITALAKFENVEADVELTPDGSVIVIYSMSPQPVIRAIQVTGNKAVTDQELRAVIRLVPNLARDDFLIDKAKRDMVEIYRKKGFYLTTVTIDESELEERGVLIFRIIEGPRVKVMAIEFEGANAFPRSQLMSEVKTRTHMLLLRPGVLDQNRLAEDVGRIDSFYRNRGYIDVQVDRRIDLSPDNREAKVVFIVVEGRPYTVGKVECERVAPSGAPLGPLELFTVDQVAALLEIKTGDVYSDDKLRRSTEILKRAYGNLGYLDVRVNVTEFRRGPEAVVDLLVHVQEGRLYKVGVISINGNFLTKDKVIRREIRLKPGRPFDATEIDESERRLRRSRLFNDVRITVQQPDPEDPEYRDVLVEVKERNTGSVNFGVAVGSDSGLFGEISIRQDNFDVGDLPESFGEFVTGRAFRGGGQRFSMVFRPGNELFQYAVSLTEPNLLETDYSLGGSFSWRQRQYRDYDETRITGIASLGRQLGDVWNASLRLRAEEVELNDIDRDAPVDVFEDAGPDTLTSVGLTLTRTTISTLTRPGKGSRLEVGFETVGALGGDIDFYRADLDYTVYLTLDEDFLGRLTTLKLNGRVGYIFGGRAPTYERYYLGGTSFRGFDFRTVSPKGIRNDNGKLGDDPIGGEWLVFAGAEYEFPLFQEVITTVLFVDSGTVTEDVGFDEYRVSVGAGLRLYIPQFGPVPLAFNFGFPIIKEGGDETQVFSFSTAFPF